MSKNDIGAALAGIFAVLASIGVYAREYLGRFTGYIWESFAALLKSKAAWAAVAVFSVASFCLGHIEGAAGKRALRSEVVTLKARANASSAVATAATAKATEAHAKVADRDGTIEALKAEIARLTSTAGAASAPKATVSRKPVAKATQKKAPAREPAKGFWPWSA
jgi:hypothetical protein